MSDGDTAASHERLCDGGTPRRWQWCTPASTSFKLVHDTSFHGLQRDRVLVQLYNPRALAAAVAKHPNLVSLSIGGAMRYKLGRCRTPTNDRQAGMHAPS